MMPRFAVDSSSSLPSFNRVIACAATLERIYSCFRVDSCVGGGAVNVDPDFIGGRGPNDNLVDAVRVEGISEFRLQRLDVQGFGAEQADLFTGGENQFDCPVAGTVFL